MAAEARERAGRRRRRRGGTEIPASQHTASQATDKKNAQNFHLSIQYYWPRETPQLFKF